MVAVKLLAEIEAPQEATEAKGSASNSPFKLLAIFRRLPCQLSCVDFYSGLPHDMTASFPRTNNQRETKSVHEESHYLFYN